MWPSLSDSLLGSDGLLGSDSLLGSYSLIAFDSLLGSDSLIAFDRLLGSDSLIGSDSLHNLCVYLTPRRRIDTFTSSFAHSYTHEKRGKVTYPLSGQSSLAAS